MNAAAMRFLLAASAVAVGASLVWLAAAVPAASTTSPGSALNTGPDGFSTLARGLREEGLLAPSVAIQETPEGLGLSPLPWSSWDLRPGDGVLTVRSDVRLGSQESQAAREWLRSGGRLAVLADADTEFVIAEQLSPTLVVHAPLRDAAFTSDPRHPVVVRGTDLFQLHEPFAVASGPESEWVLTSSEVSWLQTDLPPSAAALRAWPLAIEIPVGEGSILVVGDADPFSNAGLDELDNGRLAEWLVAWLSEGGGGIYVDEGHRSGGAAVRIDLVFRAVPAEGRAVLAALVGVAALCALTPWRRWTVEPLRRWLEPGPADEDPVERVLRRNPSWNASLLSRLSSGAEREPAGPGPGAEGPDPQGRGGPAP